MSRIAISPKVKLFVVAALILLVACFVGLGYCGSARAAALASSSTAEVAAQDDGIGSVVFWIGIVLYTMGAGLDVYTTKRAVVDNPTRFHEANPIMAWIMRKLGGMPGLVIAKLAAGSGLVAFAYGMDAAMEAGTGLSALGALFGWQGLKNRALFRRKTA